MHRVQKLLSNYGYCSRRKAEELIQQGRVKVNDRLITIGDKATEQDNIFVDNKLINRQRKVYLIFNKPVGCVTALTDPKYKTVMDYIKLKERVFPIGRLDYNTSGLLLLTNDGDFANNIMHPRYEIKKTYMVKIDKPITEDKIEEIEKGVNLEFGKTSPAKVKKYMPNLLEIIIHEGRNRIVRRIFEELGFKVLSLERIRIGNLALGNLKQGTYKTLTKKDTRKIFE
ncbi:MAG: pseudouridine synthase [Nanoarchaeota archaeon]